MNTTINKEESKPLPQLVKGSSTYRLIVPEKVERIIRYLINKFPHTEWSGVLFCTHKGSFEDGDLVITCEDIFPMDLGSSGWTEFKMTEDVAAYMAEHIELFDCDMQLVHSHHVLGAFLSGQDMKMVQQEGNDTNCFVSLVVDTKGEYVAVVTRKINIQAVCTVNVTNRTYEFFGEGNRDIPFKEDNDSKDIKVTNKEVIEYSDLKLERHEVPSDLGNTDDLKHLDERFDEIAAKKEEQRKQNVRQSFLWKDWDSDDFFGSYHKNRKLDIQDSSHKEESPDNCLDIGWTPNPKKIHDAVVHILTCNLILNAEKIDLRQWVTRHMVNVYKKIFGKNCLNELGNDQMGSFVNWRDFIIQHTLDFFDYSDAPDELFADEDLMTGKVATAIIKELTRYMELKGLNDGARCLIDSYIDVLFCYVIE